tara:strand:- start:850 stop:1002 length:153 start_codon:yes stop_codon:yes gene_type:complete
MKGRILSEIIRPVVKIEYYTEEFKYKLENILRKYLSYTAEFLKKTHGIVQ